MKFGKGSITVWQVHYAKLINAAIIKRLDPDLQLILDFIKVTQDNRKKSLKFFLDNADDKN